jgi:predicted transposase/invertase (TIGR01784 family)
MPHSDNQQTEQSIEQVILTPHDRLFQASLTHPETAKDFFNKHLPQEVINTIKFDIFKLCQKTFIGRRFKKYEADVIYQTEIDGKPIYLYLLIEAQSTIDSQMPFRLLCYMLEIMRYHVEKLGFKDLPLVYPSVFYTGKQQYTGPREIIELFGEHQALARQIFYGPFNLVEVNKIPNETLKQHPYIGLIEFAYKAASAQDFVKQLREGMDELRQWVKRLGFATFENVLNYWIQVLDTSNREGLSEVLSHTFPEQRETLMGTIAEQFRQEGMQKGIQQGMQKGIQQGMQKGIQQGMQKGIQQGFHAGEVALLLRQLKHRFHKIPAPYQKLIEEAKAETLLKWGERLLDAKRLEDVFNQH